MSTSLTYHKSCAWCNCQMKRGEKSWILKSGKFDEHIRKLLSVICSKNKVDCIGVKLLIMSYLTSGKRNQWKWDFEAYCTDCGIFDLKFTRSGRTIYAPMRLADETFVTGSGVGGCDQYDRGYDRGVYYDNELEDKSDIKGFVVEDDDVSEESSTESSEEEEISEWSEESDDDWSGGESD